MEHPSPPTEPVRRVLLISTASSLARELERALGEGVVRSATLGGCTTESCDALLLDAEDGLATVRELVQCEPALPVIVLLPTADEVTELECLALGADEVVTRDALTPAVFQRAVRSAQARRASERLVALPEQLTVIAEHRRAEEALQTRVAHAQALLRFSRRLERVESHAEILAATREVLLAAIGFRRVWLYRLGEGGTHLELLLMEEARGEESLVRRAELLQLEVAGDPMLEEIVSAEGVVVVDDARTDPRTNKEIVAALGNRTIVNVPIFLAGKRLGAIGTGSFGDEGVRALTPEELEFLTAIASHVAAVLDRVTAAEQRERAEDALRLFRTLVDQSNDSFEVIDPFTAQFLDVNERGCLDLGYTREELLRLTVFDIDPTVSRANWPEWSDHLRRRGKVTIQGIHQRKDGTTFPVEVNLRWVGLDREYVVSVARDVSERKQLEEQVRQSQKMEAIGQLAAGVAHDFNNLLCVISGYTELCQMRLTPHTPEWTMLGEIRTAGDRATALTRQLLAFSRQQVLAPKVLGLNGVVTDVRNMLQRLIGEDILLSTILTPDLHPVKVDPGQIGQVLMNMVVNARDAMPQGGRLTIETRNVERNGSASEVAGQPAVLLSVSDTGGGMSPEVRQRIFEPFFTTKGVGSGTGLGLAVVHGIVEQSGGEIEVETEAGKGTTFRIVLPAAVEHGPDAVRSPAIAPGGGTETVLLVEDDDLVRQFTADALRPFGYQLLKASSGDEALRVAADHTGPIHLLLTDVVMPRMNGRQLAETLQSLYPELKVLFVSGYTDDAVVRRGVHQSEVAFLQKPVSPSLLAARVRELLDRSPRLES